MENNNIQLNGTINEQAQQLWEVLKTKELSIEALDKVVPMSNEFLKEFASVLHKEIASLSESHNLTLKIYEKSIDKLLSPIDQKDISSEERAQILECVKNLSDDLKEITKNHDDNSSKFKTFCAACMSFIILVVIILAGGNPNKPKEA